MEKFENKEEVQDQIPETPEESILNNQVQPSKMLENSCPTCSSLSQSATNQFVYTIGQIQPRFPSIGIEKEYIQAISRANTKGLTDSQVLHSILSDTQNHYLASKICWLFTIQSLETYLLQPSNQSDINNLLESINPTPKTSDLNVVIGIRGPIAPPNYCNGLQIPIIKFDQIYSFDIDSLIKSIPKPSNVPAKQFIPAAEELFMRIIQIADNAGASDEHRALNYIAVRYSEIYYKTAECFGRNFSLTGVEVITSRLSGVRRIVDTILIFTNRNSDVTEKYFCRVDVTEEFPFLISKMQPYFDR